MRRLVAVALGILGLFVANRQMNRRNLLPRLVCRLETHHMPSWPLTDYDREAIRAVLSDYESDIVNEIAQLLRLYRRRSETEVLDIVLTFAEFGKQLDEFDQFRQQYLGFASIVEKLDRKLLQDFTVPKTGREAMSEFIKLKRHQEVAAD